MMKKVSSTSIGEVGFDNGDLHVVFKQSQKHYVYHGVNEDTYGELLEASSIGRFVNAEIKDNYNYDLIS